MSVQLGDYHAYRRVNTSAASFDAEAALRLVVESTSADTGKNFFRSLTYSLACALGVRYALITQCSGEPPDYVQTLAFWQGDSFGENFSYPTAQTPCQRVLGGEICYCPDSVQQLFPYDLDLVELDAVAYLGVPIISSTGGVLGHLAIVHDQSLATEPIGLSILKIFAVRAAAEMERQAVMEQLRYDSLHDALTGLPNRTYFAERFTAICSNKKESFNHPFAVLFLDLDRFKIINDSLGHTAGNQLLVEVSQRLLSCVESQNTVARLGGDEFTVLLERTESYAQVIAVVQCIQKSLAEAFQIDQCNVHIGVSIGIVFQTPALICPADYLRSADLAMYQAKREGGGEYRVFNQKMHTQAVHRLNQEAALRRAIDEGELQLYYQPIFSLLERRLTGFEALLRWWCPVQHRQVMPTEFIPIAEETGLILPLSWWLIQTACYQLRTWQTRLNCPLTMNVNVSNLQFDQNNVVDKILGILSTTGVEPRTLRFELTESMLMVKPGKIANIMNRLRPYGIQFHLDDFGQGSSSLSLLHELPIDAVKIDHTFVSRMLHDKTAAAIVKTIVTLANSLEISSIAEGIETPEQLQQLLELRCHYGQGYLVAPPMPPNRVESWLASTQSVSTVSDIEGNGSGKGYTFAALR